MSKTASTSRHSIDANRRSNDGKSRDGRAEWGGGIPTLTSNLRTDSPLCTAALQPFQMGELHSRYFVELYRGDANRGLVPNGNPNLKS